MFTFFSNSLILSILRYFIRPTITPIVKDIDSTLKKLFDSSRIVSWMILSVIPTSILIGVLTFITGYNSEHAIAQITAEAPIYLVFLLGAIIAPIREEIMFRLPLRFRPFYIALASFLFVEMILGFFIPQGLGLWLSVFIFSLLIPLLFAIIIFFIVRIEQVSTYLKVFYERYFGIIFYTSTIIFGLIHIFNFSNIMGYFYLIPFLVLPQILAGYFLGFIRINYGFVYAILVHAAYNLLLLLPAVALANTEIKSNTPIVILLCLPVLLTFVYGMILFAIDLFVLLKNRS